MIATDTTAPPCDRCGTPPIRGSMLGWFNTGALCFDCYGDEQRHPDYEAARRQWQTAHDAGTLDFGGVGVPPELHAVAAFRRAVRLTTNGAAHLCPQQHRVSYPVARGPRRLGEPPSGCALARLAHHRAQHPVGRPRAHCRVISTPDRDDQRAHWCGLGLPASLPQPWLAGVPTFCHGNLGRSDGLCADP